MKIYPHQFYDIISYEVHPRYLRESARLMRGAARAMGSYLQENQYVPDGYISILGSSVAIFVIIGVMMAGRSWPEGECQ